MLFTGRELTWATASPQCWPILMQTLNTFQPLRSQVKTVMRGYSHFKQEKLSAANTLTFRSIREENEWNEPALFSYKASVNSYRGSWHAGIWYSLLTNSLNWLSIPIICSGHTVHAPALPFTHCPLPPTQSPWKLLKLASHLRKRNATENLGFACTVVIKVISELFATSNLALRTPNTINHEPSTYPHDWKPTHYITC